jgi:hypothetical protein
MPMSEIAALHRRCVLLDEFLINIATTRQKVLKQTCVSADSVKQVTLPGSGHQIRWLT